MRVSVSFPLVLTVLIVIVRTNGECEDGDIRLGVVDTTIQEYLEVCVNATWMAVCDYGGMWTPQDATVACRHQGKSAMGAQGYHLPVEVSTQGVVIGCHGDEDLLGECRLVPSNGTQCLGVGTVCQPNEVDFSVLQICYTSMVISNQVSSISAEGTSNITEQIVATLRGKCSCSYSDQYVVLVPEERTHSSLKLRLTIAFNSPLREAAQLLAHSAAHGDLKDISIDGIQFTAMKECAQIYSTTQSRSIAPTQTHAEHHVSPSLAVSTQPAHKSKSSSIKANRIGLCIGLVVASVALVSVTVVTVIFVYIKFKGNFITARVQESTNQNIVSSPSGKFQNPTSNYEEVEYVEQVTVGLHIREHVDHEGSGENQEKMNGGVDDNAYYSVLEELLVGSPLPIPHPIHHYETVGGPEHTEDGWASRGEASIPELELPDEDGPPMSPWDEQPRVRVAPYRVSTILLIDEPKERTGTHQSTSRSRTPIPTDDGYSHLEKSPSPYTTLEPFISNDSIAHKNSAEEEYNHLVHH